MNFFVREIERGRDAQERGLETAKVSRGGRRWWRQKAGLQIFWEKDRERISSVFPV